MTRPMVGEVEQISAKIPQSPNDIADFIRKAANYITFIEDSKLVKLVHEKDGLKTSISAIESAMSMRRDEHIGNHMEEIPKDFRKSATATNQYVDYNVFGSETKQANIELITMKKELSLTRSKITAWSTIKEQYERAIQASTMVLAWEKAQLKLGGS